MINLRVIFSYLDKYAIVSEVGVHEVSRGTAPTSPYLDAGPKDADTNTSSEMSFDELQNQMLREKEKKKKKIIQGVK